MIDLFVSKAFQVKSQLKLSHWQTTTYSRHIAIDNFLPQFDLKIDEFIEVYQGRYGRVKMGNAKGLRISLHNYSDKQISVFIDDYLSFINQFYKKLNNDTLSSNALLNTLDEINALIYKLKYLFTLN